MRFTVTVVLSGFVVIGTQLATCQTEKVSSEAACHSRAPASTGGPAPRNPTKMVIRYLGTSNYEIDYKGKVLLLDAFYDGQRGPHTRLIGIEADDIQHDDAIYVGHPHIDHIADAPSMSKRLNIPVVTSPAARPVLEREQGPENLVRYVSGGETLKMNGYTVMTALAEQSALDPKVAAKYNEAAMAVNPLTPEDIAYFKRALSYNPPATDPTLDIPKHGTIAYVFVFDNGFKVAFRASPGAVTQGERDLMQKVGGSVDVAILGYNGFGIDSVVDVTMKLAESYKPKLLLPAHQDAYIGGVADVSTAPSLLGPPRQASRDAGGLSRSTGLRCVSTQKVGMSTTTRSQEARDSGQDQVTACWPRRGETDARLNGSGAENDTKDNGAHCAVSCALLYRSLSGPGQHRLRSAFDD